MTAAVAEPRIVPRQTWIGLTLAGMIVAGWAVLHVYGVYFHRWGPLTLVIAPAIVAVQTWLSVGLFIVAHDAMHGSLWPGSPRWNQRIGRLALGLYAVMPDASWTIRMARAGVPTVQLRFKSTEASAIRAEVRAAVAGVQGTGARLFINDHWQEAIDAGAYGVHLGQEDLQAMTPEGLGAIRQAGLRLGLSTHGYAEMLLADAHHPSYIAMGAVFPTTLKQMATAPQGTGRLRAYAALLRDTPHMAIGGIDLHNLPEVLNAGVRSVGVVRALMAEPDLDAAVARWKAALKPT